MFGHILEWRDSESHVRQGYIKSGDGCAPSGRFTTFLINMRNGQ
jgi:hypothetical protein